MVKPRLLGFVVVVTLVAALLMISGCATPALADAPNRGAADDLAALVLNLIGAAVVVFGFFAACFGVVGLLGLGYASLPEVTDEELRRAFPRAPYWGEK